MVKEKGGPPLNRFAKLEHSVVELTAALAEYSKSLDKHSAEMESLIQAIGQLDETVKKEMSIKSHQQLIQLKEAVTTFIEYNINPQYYKESSYLQLTESPQGVPAERVKIKPNIKSNR